MCVGRLRDDDVDSLQMFLDSGFLSDSPRTWFALQGKTLNYEIPSISATGGRNDRRTGR